MVRRGYDAISLRYRGDDGSSNPDSAEDTARYTSWVDELAELVPRQAVVADLGCGCGLPATDLLCRKGWRVVGVDFSRVQLRRAQRLAPAAALVQADLAHMQLTVGCLDAAVSFYTLIHLPLHDQRRLFDRITQWLRPGGYLLAIVGAETWTGIEAYFGEQMHWDHADTQAYLDWLPHHDLHPVWHRYIPEGNSGHTLLLARTSNPHAAPDPAAQ
jgi:SAM-dependent methyltransferase